MHIKQERRCVACRANKLQNEMIRIARVNDEFMLDLNHKLGGRGAYVCMDNKCIDLTIKKKLLNRTFKSNLEAKVYDMLGEYEQNN